MALFGKKPSAATPFDDLPEELKKLLEETREERTKLSSLLGRTKGSVEKLEKLDAPLQTVTGRAEEVTVKLRAVEDRAAQLEAMVGRLDQLSRRAASVEQGQATVESRMSKVSTELADIQAVATGLRESVAAAALLKAEIQAAAGPGGGVADLKAKLDQLREQFLTYGHDVTAARDQQQHLKRQQEEALLHTAHARDEAARVKSQLDEAAARIAKVEVARPD